MTENKDVKDAGISLTGLTEKKTAIVVFAVFLVVCSMSMLSGGEASIGGYGENPTAFKVVLTTDGAISLFAPADTPGHWETGGVFISEQSEMFFCPMEKFGVIKYTFVPDNPDRCRSSVYAVICRFAG